MKKQFCCLAAVALLLFVNHSNAQRRHRGVNPNDTISSRYVPSDLFSPLFYTERGNDYHAANGAPGIKYWQNRLTIPLKPTLIP